MNGDFTFWIIIILELLRSSTACGHSSWGWRRHLQLTRFRQWDICPSLLQNKPSRFVTVSIAFIIIQYSNISPKVIADSSIQLGASSWETLSHSPGLWITIFLPHAACILTDRITLLHWVIISDQIVHSGQLVAVYRVVGAWAVD